MRLPGFALLPLSLAACGSHTPAASSPAPPTVDVRVPSADGVPIHYVVEGAGPAVVLVHCLGCNLHYWDVAAADLVRDHRVLRLDLAGHGTSGADRKAWTIEAFAGDVRAAVDAAGIAEFTLVGHSMSGPIALEVAKELGDRVTGIVPIDTLLDVDEQLPDAKRAELVQAVRADYPRFLDRGLLSMMAKNADPKVIARVKSDALALPPDRTASILDSLFTYPAAATLDHLAMPIVAIDADVEPLALDHERAHAPQFDARILHGTGHWIMLDKPAEFASMLRDVVVSIESGKARKRSG